MPTPPTPPKVLTTMAALDKYLAPFKGIAEVIQGPSGWGVMSRAEVLSFASELDAIINQGELRIDAGLLNAAPKLKIVVNMAIGFNNMDLPLMASRSVWAVNTPDAVVDSTADFTIGVLLALVRRIPELDRFVCSGQWGCFEPGRWDGAELAGKTIGIIGYGQIGQAVARRLRAFGMNVIFHTRRNTGDSEQRSLEDLLIQSDVVSLHVPLTPETKGLINRERFQLMKPGAVFINMSRGKVAEETALVESLQSGHLSGAGLDVFENEPQIHPALRKMPNVVLSPHTAGGTHESRNRAWQHCIENVVRVLQGKPPKNPLNPTKT
ncbi:MAG: D-glycerate dehydrogenase [bacterium]